MFLAGLFITGKGRNHPNCSSNDKWISKMWYIYTIDYYLAIKRNEVLFHAIRWMSLENIMLSERSQTKNNKSPIIIWFQLYKMSKTDKKEEKGLLFK